MILQTNVVVFLTKVLFKLDVLLLLATREVLQKTVDVTSVPYRCITDIITSHNQGWAQVQSVVKYTRHYLWATSTLENLHHRYIKSVVLKLCVVLIFQGRRGIIWFCVIKSRFYCVKRTLTVDSILLSSDIHNQLYFHNSVFNTLV